MSGLRIACFAWNAAGLRICETTSSNEAIRARGGLRGIFKKACVPADFIDPIRSYITESKPDVAILTTEDEDSSDTYFHAEIIPQIMSGLGFALFKRDKLDGVGEEASNNTPDSVITGPPGGSALRMSIYISDKEVDNFVVERKAVTNFFSRKAQKEIICKQGDRVSGAIATYMRHNVYGKICAIALHLPSAGNALGIVNNIRNYESYRAAITAANRLCMINIVNEAVETLPIDMRPDHIILMGDFNSDVVIQNTFPAQMRPIIDEAVGGKSYKGLLEYDELRQVMAAPLDGFLEGVNNAGPRFPPNYKLVRGRYSECSESSCYDNIFGWHDRILYKTTINAQGSTLECVDYRRIDSGNMKESDHAGVLGLYEIAATPR